MPRSNLHIYIFPEVCDVGEVAEALLKGSITKYTKVILVEPGLVFK